VIDDKGKKIYTKEGDNGNTSLMKYANVSKSDDRIHLLGTIDELTCNLGLVKTFLVDTNAQKRIEQVQENLMTIMAAVADQYNKIYRLEEDKVTVLEDEINRMELLFQREKKFVLPGGNTLSAQIDVARTVARRAERQLIIVDKKFTVDKTAKKYMNRLADYLYILARYTDFLHENPTVNHIHTKNNVQEDMTTGNIIHSVTRNLGVIMNKIDLITARKLISKIKEESAKRGLNAVIAVCAPEGTMISVDVMDGAYLASFDIAMKKAYTSVAVRMSTKKLGELSRPGETFYGIDKADNGRMIIFGGGVPLMVDNKMIGGLGISGGTSEEDNSLAEYGLYTLSTLI
jgi:ATP:cob(I)alamin adenosyltransferase